MDRLLSVIVCGVFLTGCAVLERAPAEPETIDATPNCGAAGLQGLLGRPEAALQTVTLPPATRILRPDDVIPLDFSPDRLTIDIDALGRISSVTCR